MKKVNDNNKLAIQMLIAMVSGIVVGLLFMAIRESVGAESTLWTTINSILFQNISVAGGEQALIAYSLILAINRPIEMLVTSLNVTGDALTSIAVAKSEGKLNLDVFNKQ